MQMLLQFLITLFFTEILLRMIKKKEKKSGVGVVVQRLKLLLAMTASHIGAMAGSQTLYFQYSFLLVCLESNKRQCMCLQPCHPSRRPRYSFWLLASTWCSHLGSEPINARFFCLLLRHSASQIKKKKKNNKKPKNQKQYNT